MSNAKIWGAFNWEDPFLLEQQLTEEERLVRDTAQSYAPEKLADMQTEISLALQGCLQAGRLKECDALAPELICLG